MTSTNFIIANIKLLIEISDDGKYKIHEDRTHIDFNPCDELPPIRKKEDGENIMQNILQMVSSSSSTNKIKWNSRDGDVSEYEDPEEEANQSDDDSSENDDEDSDKEEEPRVYNHEINNQPKKTSLTTTLKNRVKNNISKKNRV